MSRMADKSRSVRRMAILLAAASVLGGCVSASLEDAAPTGQGQANGQQSDNSFVREGALRNDSYPTFERMPVAATDQLTESDKARLEAEMDAVRAAYGSGALSEAAYRARMQELETLARTHGRDVQMRLRN